MAYHNHDYIALVCEAGLLIQGKDRGRLGGNRSLTHSELWVKCRMSYVNNNYIAIIDMTIILHITILYTQYYFSLLPTALRKSRQFLVTNIRG